MTGKILPGINLQGSPPDPATFEGPLNVFIGLHGVGLAANQADENKTLYDENFPDAPAVEAMEYPDPIGKPISAGKPINVMRQKKYVIDRDVAKRVLRRRLPLV